MREVNFTPHLCEHDGVSYCKGCDYKKHMEHEFPNHKIRCGKDYLEKYRESMNKEEEKTFDDLINRLRKKGTGFLSREEAIRFAYEVIDEIHVLDPKNSPVPLEIIADEPTDWAIRISELSKQCAAHVFLDRKGKIPKKEEVMILAEQGTQYHRVSLEDYDFEEDKTIIYLPTLFLDNKTSYERKNSSEVIVCHRLKYKGKRIDLKATIDAAFKIGNYGIIIDIKRHATPFYPASGPVRQVTMYGILAEIKTGVEVRRGLIVYREKLGKGFSLRAFSIDPNTTKGLNRRLEAKDFAHEIYTKVPIFEENPQELINYRNSIRPKCFSKKRKTSEIVPKCYNYKFCWEGGLEKVIVELMSSKKSEAHLQS